MSRAEFTKPTKRSMPEYSSYRNMLCRCEQPTTPNYSRYGGRGIAVCERWRSDFWAFREDMGPRPSSKHSIDRINGNGDYEPGNCRWATRREQGRNTQSNRLVEVGGKAVTLAEAAEKAPVPYNTVLYRLKRGWTLDKALSRAAHKGVRP
jgi:hypothetical protein